MRIVSRREGVSTKGPGPSDGATGASGEALSARAEKVQPGGPLQGHIDICDGVRLEGWAFDPMQADSRVRLEIRIDSEVVGDVMADQFRADLAEAGGFGDGCCSFAIDMPIRLSARNSHVIEVCRADDGALLPGSPKIVTGLELRTGQSLLADTPPGSAVHSAAYPIGTDRPLEGSLDVCNSFRLEGWAFDRAQWGYPVRLEIRVDGELIGHVVANRYRGDVAKTGGFGNGYCGFAIDMPVRLSSGVDHVIEVFRADDGAPLRGSPKAVPVPSRLDSE